MNIYFLKKQSCGKIRQAFVYITQFVHILNLGEQCGNFYKHLYVYMIWPSDFLPVTYPKKSFSTRKSHMDYKVYYCLIYNSKMLETAELFSKRTSYVNCQ